MIVYSIAIASPQQLNAISALTERLKDLGGLYGVYPDPITGNILAFFHSANGATIARYVLKGEGYLVGYNIGAFAVDQQTGELDFIGDKNGKPVRS